MDRVSDGPIRAGDAFGEESEWFPFMAESLMRLDPEKIGYLVMGHAKRLGRMKAEEIPQLGESIAALAQKGASIPCAWARNPAASAPRGSDPQAISR